MKNFHNTTLDIIILKLFYCLAIRNTVYNTNRIKPTYKHIKFAVGRLDSEYKMSMSDSARSNKVRIIQTNDDGAVCRLGIPNSVLEWMHLQRNKCKFSDMVNKSFSYQEMMLNGSARVEECLRIQAYRAYTRIRSSSRRKKDKVKNQESFVTIFGDDVVKPQQLQEKLTLVSNTCCQVRYVLYIHV